MTYSIWAEFAACLFLIGYAGTRLSVYGDVIADKTGLSGTWVGLVMLATATSLPELITGLSSVTLASAPNIAVGNVLGSCVLNLLTLVVVDFLHRKESIYRRASQGHILSAGFGVVMIGLVGFNVLLGQRNGWAIGHVGAYTPVIVLMYVIAVRAIFLYEKQQVIEFTEDVTDRYAGTSLRRAIAGYAWAAAIVVAAGVWMPFIATRLAVAMGWHTSFVGTLLVSAATTMPELMVTLGAVRLGALDMAIANLLGSNLFNIVIVAIDDLFYRPGPLLSQVSAIHGVSAMSAVIMTGLAIVGILYRPETRVLKTVGWISLGLFTVYLLNSTVLYLHSE
ncbi:sodium:calcium antiporter [Methylocaldum sp.]|uniref:sodium:calcium antiporter n=1 Tax=Methylocaldum sp. TaxID=1969727 RepID=UPI002D3E5C49|nr:sodium:calcium antiporter [Methylocaldum sp.]HYE35452.1 sodium:calcium antiporter [Methylocaldum sp.]